MRLDHQSKSISFINIDCLGSHFIYQLTSHFVSQFHPSSIWMMIHSRTFISQNKNKSHTTCKDWTQRKHKNTGANDIPWFYFILFSASTWGLLFSSPALIVSLILTIDAPEFALSQALEATTFHAVYRLHSCNFVAKLYIIPTTDVQLAIILKRSCQRKERNFTDICWNCWELNSQLIKICFTVPTISYYYK